VELRRGLTKGAEEAEEREEVGARVGSLVADFFSSKNASNNLSVVVLRWGVVGELGAGERDLGSGLAGLSSWCSYIAPDLGAAFTHGPKCKIYQNI
jgi:hypothetical protein